MHEILFAESANPPVAQCLGLPLRPYSTGHELALLRTQNPLLTLSWAGFDELPSDKQRIALVRAADICSMTWAESQFVPVTFLDRWKYARVCRKWRNCIARAVFPLEIAEFRNYLQSGRQLFPTLSSSVPEDAEAYEIANKGEKLEGGRALGSPLLAQLIPFATGRLNMTHEQVMDAPLAYIANLYFAYLESKGQTAVENHREAEERATLARMRAEVKAEKDAAAAAWGAAKTIDEKLAAIAAHERILDMFPEAVELKGHKCPA